MNGLEGNAVQWLGHGLGFKMTGKEICRMRGFLCCLDLFKFKCIRNIVSKCQQGKNTVRYPVLLPYLRSNVIHILVFIE